MPLATREHPADRLPLIADLRLTNQALEVERLVRGRDFRQLRRYLFDLQREIPPDSE